MKATKLIALGIAAALAVPAVAGADPRNPYHDSYGSYGSYDATPLAEVSADPRDGTDVVDLNPHRRFAQLELRAREAPVALRRVRIETADGQVFSQRVHRWLSPGESVRIDLPGDRARVSSVAFDYGPRRFDRTPARLEVYGVGGGHDRHDRSFQGDGWSSPSRIHERGQRWR